MIKFSDIFGRLGNNMFQGAYIYSQYRDGKIPDIYIQDYKYFDKYRDELKALYGSGILKNKLDYIAVHVRRGDYVNNSFYVDLTKTNYYETAFKEFPNEKFMIFSDDIEWCKDQNMFQGCEFSNKSEIDDLNTMSSCKGIIMANSSFSWWGAYLSDAKVVAPKLWYSDGIERTICLPEWKKI